VTAANFRPRRLGHVNLWVSELERSIQFYEAICGVELVRRERDIRIGFHSNGNTHHDIGLVEISKGEDRYGRDGTLQIPKTRGTTIGLNHLGWEMATEADLVEAYKRGKASGAPIHRTVDHLISHSVYTSDPDGNGHEFYADALKDWRKIYNLDVEDEVTGEWDPLAKPPSTERNYNVQPAIRQVERAPIHPSHITDATLATRRFSAMKDFFIDVAGLSLVHEEAGSHRSAVFAGSERRPDLVLSEASSDERIGLRSFGFVLADQALAEVVRRTEEKGLSVSDDRHPLRKGVLIRDPDGFAIALHE
jgi:catechol 2,3-dioxygenase